MGQQYPPSTHFLPNCDCFAGGAVLLCFRITYEIVFEGGFMQ